MTPLTCNWYIIWDYGTDFVEVELGDATPGEAYMRALLYRDPEREVWITVEAILP